MGSLLSFVLDFLLLALLARVGLHVKLGEEHEEEQHVEDGQDRVDDGEATGVVEEQDQAVAHHSQKLDHLKFGKLLISYSFVVTFIL
jgi:hypothetical protein